MKMGFPTEKERKPCKINAFRSLFFKGDNQIRTGDQGVADQLHHTWEPS